MTIGWLKLLNCLCKLFVVDLSELALIFDTCIHRVKGTDKCLDAVVMRLATV
jgi:hypothetical protein